MFGAIRSSRAYVGTVVYNPQTYFVLVLCLRHAVIIIASLAHLVHWMSWRELATSAKHCVPVSCAVCLRRRWHNVGPASQTLALHGDNVGPACLAHRGLVQPFGSRLHDQSCAVSDVWAHFRQLMTERLPFWTKIIDSQQLLLKEAYFYCRAVKSRPKKSYNALYRVVTLTCKVDFSVNS